MTIELSWHDAVMAASAPRIRLVRGFYRGATVDESKEWAGTVVMDGKTPDELVEATKDMIGRVAAMAYEALRV